MGVALESYERARKGPKAADTGSKGKYSQRVVKYRVRGHRAGEMNPLDITVYSTMLPE